MDAPGHATSALAGRGGFRQSANRLGNCPLGHRAELAACTGLFAGQPGLVRPPDVIGPAEFLGQPDHSRGDVDLAFEHAVARAGRVGMVCRLCQDSPKDKIASQETFLDLSRTLNSSLPNVWQIELIDQVM